MHRPPESAGQSHAAPSRRRPSRASVQHWCKARIVVRVWIPRMRPACLSCAYLPGSVPSNRKTGGAARGRQPAADTAGALRSPSPEHVAPRAVAVPAYGRPVSVTHPCPSQHHRRTLAVTQYPDAPVSAMCSMTSYPWRARSIARAAAAILNTRGSRRMRVCCTH